MLWQSCQTPRETNRLGSCEERTVEGHPGAAPVNVLTYVRASRTRADTPSANGKPRSRSELEYLTGLSRGWVPRKTNVIPPDRARSNAGTERPGALAGRSAPGLQG